MSPEPPHGLDSSTHQLHTHNDTQILALLWHDRGWPVLPTPTCTSSTLPHRPSIALALVIATRCPFSVHRLHRQLFSKFASVGVLFGPTSRSPTASNPSTSPTMQSQAPSLTPIPYLSFSDSGASSSTPPRGNQNATDNAEGSKSTPGKPAAPRTARACSSCNRQKLRCDGQQPCQRCVSLKITELCEYLPSMRGKTRKRKKKDDEGSNSPSQPPGGPHQVFPHHMDSDMAMWKRDASLSHKGPKNSALWGLQPPPKNPMQRLNRSPSPVRVPGTGSSMESSVAEKLTTLPLPGDPHNPLGLLAEASATAKSDHDPNSPQDTMRANKEGEEAYYAPLDRVLKEEAPHIMSFIKVHEWVMRCSRADDSERSNCSRCTSSISTSIFPFSTESTLSLRPWRGGTTFCSTRVSATR